MSWRPYEPSLDEARRVQRERDANTCNLHKDCAAANEKARQQGKARALHCWTDDCEDCFGC